MGIGKSKFPISYDDACKRVGDDVVKRLKETFDKYASNTGILPRVTFLKDIFGDGMPPKLAECLYEAFNGGQKGIKFSDLLRGLVVIIHGTKDEKIAFITLMLSEEGIIRKEDLQKFLADVDIDPSPADLDTLFNQEHWVGLSEFETWVKKNPELCSVTEWLLADEPEEEQKRLSFTAPPDPPTSFQTLAQKFNVEEQDVMDIEKAYWGLKGSNGKFDETVLVSIMCPPLPESLCKNIFHFLDLNGDLFIDLSEMVRGLAMLCRESLPNRKKLCFELLDTDNDGLLNRTEMKEALEMMKEIQENSLPVEDDEGRGNNTNHSDSKGESRGEETSQPLGETGEERRQPCCDIDSLLEQFEGSLQEGGVSLERFVEWSDSDSGCGLVQSLLQVILEVCHVKMGLRPTTPEEEMKIVRGYMSRFKKTGRKKGQIVNLICSSWFNRWRLVTKFEMKDYPISSIEQQLVAIEPPIRGKPTSNKSSSSSGSMSLQDKMLGPVGEPADGTELVEIPDEEGGDGYTHIVTEQSNSNSSSGSGSLWPFSLCSASISPSSVSPSMDRPVGGDKGGIMKERRGLGPIDNTILCEPEMFVGGKKLISLTNEGGYLRSGLKEYSDYYVLPNEIWKALITWYGVTGFGTVSSLPRTVVDDEGTLELYPVMFKVFKHTTLPASKQTKNTAWTSFLEIIGFRPNVGDSNMSTAPGFPGDSAQPIAPRRVLYYTATFDKGTTIQQMCELMQQVLRIKPEDLRIYDVTNEENPELLDDEDKTIQELGFQNGHKILIETRSKDNTWPEELMAVMKDALNQEMAEQEKQNEKGSKPEGTRVVCGATGLSNLGNTCFMNSALQCLSNVQPLKIYFTEKDHYVEINKKNPLGTKGVVAKRYGELVQDLWNGQSKSITPLKFRFTVARHAPQFNNFQQQDAQELLSFVIDGIHEDLNRVQEKPYRELADSDDRPDCEVADEAWQYHLERNDSVIVDLLQGQLKSVVRCSTCQYKSVKFDPFTFLSLPLPMDEKVHLEVIVIRLDGSQPIRYGLKQDLEGKYFVLKDILVQKTKIQYFMLVDVFGGTIRSFLQDKQKMKSGLSGWLYAYEVPPPPPREPSPLMSRSTSPVLVIKENCSTATDRGKAQNEPDKEQTNSVDKQTVDANENELATSTTNESTTTPTTNESIATPTTNESNVTLTTNQETLTSKSSEQDVITGATELKSERDQTDSTKDAATDGTKNEEKISSSTDAVNNSSTAPATETSPSKGTSSSLDPDEETNRLAAASAQSSPKKPTEIPKKIPTYCSPGIHGFLFAFHRKTLRMENYFISSQKNRPVLFNVPMVIPCHPSTSRSEVYATIWKQVQRLIIPDPPNTKSDESISENSYPYVLKMVGRDGLFCCRCPWYRFCRGCAIPCDTEPIGPDDAHYIAIEWSDVFLHLKYQYVLERPIDDASMEALKTQDTKPIDLSDCFKAFSKDEELGEDEYWYCKKCQDHRPARKTLSIWRLPPILIVHLKRFQFNNGRWVKSQKVVNFPINGLEPKAYEGVNVETQPLEDRMTVDREVSVTPPINEESDVKPLEENVPVEVPVEVLQQNNTSPEEEGVGEDDQQSHIPSTSSQTIQEEEEEQQQQQESTENKQATENRPEEETKESHDDHQQEASLKKEEKIEDGEESGVTNEELKDSNPEEPSVQTTMEEKEEQQCNTCDEDCDADKTEGDESSSKLEGNSETERSIYDLFAVTCHAGVLGGGHYTSFAKNPNNRWYYYNDSSCKETTESKVQNESAYMLFYELRGLNDDYSKFRAKSLRQGLNPNPSPLPVDDDDKEFKESLRAGVPPPKGGGRNSSGCRTQ